ncbi:MAG: SIMPL domain-containing protein [Kiritimatiellae bacterium]|nr:SIMPL domain-containing protein [Kiritimatiellia bacterium]
MKRTAALLIAPVLLVAVCARAASLPQPQLRHVTVQGEGEATVQPDVAKLTMGLFIRDRSHAQAKAEADRKTGKLMESLARLGVHKADVRTTQIKVSSQYTKGKGSQEFSDYCDLNVDLTVVVRDLAKIDAVVETAIKSGINNIKGVTFHTTREAELRAKATQLAVIDAKNSAALLARQLSVNLGKVQSAVLRDATGAPALLIDELGLTQNQTLLPEPVTIRSRVEVTFELMN